MKTKKTTAGLRKGSPSGKARAAAPLHTRPSIGDPDREQSIADDGDLPDLDNETVHKTERPNRAVLEDDDLDDELAQEHQTDRDEDVSEGSPLHVGHSPGRS